VEEKISPVKIADAATELARLHTGHQTTKPFYPLHSLTSLLSKFSLGLKLQFMIKTSSTLIQILLGGENDTYMCVYIYWYPFANMQQLGKKNESLIQQKKYKMHVQNQSGSER